MHLGMQRLDPPVHHLGKAGEVGDVLDLQPGRGDRLRGAAGRDQFDAMRRRAPWRIRSGRSCRKRIIERGLRGAVVSHGQGPCQGMLMPRRAAIIPALPDGAPSKSPVARGWLVSSFWRGSHGGGAAFPTCLTCVIARSEATKHPSIPEPSYGFLASLAMTICYSGNSGSRLRCDGRRHPTWSSARNSSGPRQRAANPAGSRSGRCGEGRHCRPETRCPQGRPCRPAPRRSRPRGWAIPAWRRAHR